MAMTRSAKSFLAAGLTLAGLGCAGAAVVRSKVPRPGSDARVILRVFDEGGNPFPGVVVTLESLESGSKRHEATDARGRAAFRNPVPPGDYMLHIEMPGYRKLLDPIVVGRRGAPEVRELNMKPVPAIQFLLLD